MKIIKRKDGTEEIEGTAEELAEYERKKAPAPNEVPVKEEKGGRKKLLKDEYVRADEAEKEMLRKMIIEEFLEPLARKAVDSLPKEEKVCPGCVKDIRDKLDEIKRAQPIVIPVPQVCPTPAKNPWTDPWKVEPWPQPYITWCTNQTSNKLEVQVTNQQHYGPGDSSAVIPTVFLSN